MAKKFKSNFQDIFTPTTDVSEDIGGKGNKEKEIVRTTLLMDKKIYEQIKACAYYERKQIKDIINEAFSLKLNSYSGEELKSIINTYLTNKNNK